MENEEPRWTVSITGSRTLRLFAVTLLALLLLIPIARIGRLVAERQGRAAGALEDVSSKWGNRQELVGPVLVIPYTRHTTAVGAGGESRVTEEFGSAVFLPERMAARGDLVSEVRRRGIFSVPVYRLDLTVEGRFGQPDFSDLNVDPARVHWERAHLVLAISDVRAIQEQASVTWNGRPAEFLPGTGSLPEYRSGIQAAVAAGPEHGDYRFSLPLALNGTAGLSLAPTGQATDVRLKSDSPNPSFQGNWLPTDRTVSGAGFEAHWSIPFLGRNFPQAWTSQTPVRPAIDASGFGVELVGPVDTYAMAERSLKYAGLFLLLTFALVWLIEVLGRVRVHPIQYLMLGAALCLFFLLELSLSEHLGFAPAYAVASLAVVGMVGAYSWVIFRRRSRAAIVAGAVAGLYGYLYVLLRNEDYALLMGSVGLFLILGAIMYATRRVDWSAPGAASRVHP